MNECLQKVALSWNKGDLELNEGNGDVLEAISYIKNTSDIYLEFTQRLVDFKSFLDDREN